MNEIFLWHKYSTHFALQNLFTFYHLHIHLTIFFSFILINVMASRWLLITNKNKRDKTKEETEEFFGTKSVIEIGEWNERFFGKQLMKYWKQKVRSNYSWQLLYIKAKLLPKSIHLQFVVSLKQKIKGIHQITSFRYLK